MKLFGTSGIRGVYGEDVTEELAVEVGLALGAYLGDGKVVIGRDPRTSSLALEGAVAAGLESAGIGVLLAGMVPTPVLALAARDMKAGAGVMITASHNPSEYNGIKLWSSDSSAFDPADEEKIEEIVDEKNFQRAEWKKIAHSQEVDAVSGYVKTIKGAVDVSKKFNVALDCGHGAGCAVSPALLEEYTEKLEKLFCDPNGRFPGRMPEPHGGNLGKLQEVVKETGADIGIAHDGDADRIGVVDETGAFVGKDQLLALLARHELGKKKGKVVVPVDTSKLVEDVVEGAGGSVAMTRVGDVHVAKELKAHGGVFGGEPSGCFIFPDVHLCPDGILASLKVLEMMGRTDKKLSEMTAELPVYHTARDTIRCEKSEKEKLVAELVEKVKSIRGVEKITELDGTRADLEDAWVLVRASGTEPMARITIEAQDEKKAEKLLKLLK